MKGQNNGVGNGTCLTGGFDSNSVNANNTNSNLNSVVNPGSTTGGSVTASLTMEKCNGSWNQKWIFDTANRRLRLQGQDLCVATYQEGDSMLSPKGRGKNSVTEGMIVTLANCDYSKLYADTGKGGVDVTSRLSDNQDFFIDPEGGSATRLFGSVGGGGSEVGGRDGDPALRTYDYKFVTGERRCYFHSNTSRFNYDKNHGGGLGGQGFGNNSNSLHTDLGCSYDPNLTREDWILQNVDKKYWPISLLEKYNDQVGREALDLAKRNLANLTEAQKKAACEKLNQGGASGGTSGGSNSTNPMNCIQLTSAITPAAAEANTDTPMEISYFFDQNYVLEVSNAGVQSNSNTPTDGSGSGNGSGTLPGNQSMVWLMRKSSQAPSVSNSLNIGVSNQKWWYFPKTGEIKTSLGGIGSITTKTIGEDPSESFKNGNGRVFSVMNRKNIIQLKPGDVGYFSSLRCLDAGDLNSGSSGGLATNQTLRIHTCQGQSNQSWSFSPDYTIYLRNVLAKGAGYPNGSTTSNGTSTSTLASGAGTGGDSQMCMDIAGTSSGGFAGDGQVGDNFAVRVLPCTLRMNQCWVSGLATLPDGTKLNSSGSGLPINPGCSAPRALTDGECASMYGGGKSSGAIDSATSYWKSTGKASRDGVGGCVLVQPQVFSDEVRGGYTPPANGSNGVGTNIGGYDPNFGSLYPGICKPNSGNFAGCKQTGSGSVYSNPSTDPDEEYVDVDFDLLPDGGQSKCSAGEELFQGICVDNGLGRAIDKLGDPTLCQKFYDQYDLPANGQDELNNCFIEEGSFDEEIELPTNDLKDMIGLSTGDYELDNKIAACITDGSGHSDNMIASVAELAVSIAPIASDIQDGITLAGYNVFQGRNANCMEKVFAGIGLSVTWGSVAFSAGVGCIAGAIVTFYAGGAGCPAGATALGVSAYEANRGSIATMKGIIKKSLTSLKKLSIGFGKKFVLAKTFAKSFTLTGLKSLRGAKDFILTRDGNKLILREILGNVYKNGKGNFAQWTIKNSLRLKELRVVGKGLVSCVTGKANWQPTWFDRLSGGVIASAKGGWCFETLEQILEAVGKQGQKITEPLAKNAAFLLGYKGTPYKSFGSNAIYKTSNKSLPKFITYDSTRHSGGFWKGASNYRHLQTPSNTLRDGTFDIYLKWIAK
jgi:Novel toxin 21